MGHFREHRARVAAEQQRLAPAPGGQSSAEAAPTGAAIRRRGSPIPSATSGGPVAGQAPITGAAGAHQAAAGQASGFAADLESLHGLTIEEKVARKHVLVEKYRAHCEAFLAGPKTGIDDPATAWWVVWLWDIGRVEEFLLRCKQAEALDVRSPMNTTLPLFRAWRIVEWSRAEIAAGRSPQPYFDQQFAEVDALAPSVGSEMLKLKGVLEEAEAETEPDPTKQQALLASAKKRYQAALVLNPKVGVRTRLEKIGRFLRVIGG